MPYKENEQKNFFNIISTILVKQKKYTFKYYNLENWMVDDLLCEQINC